MKTIKNRNNFVALKIIILFIIVAICIYCWAKYYEPNMLVVKKEVIYLPNWDPKLDDLKVGLISDLHVGCNSMDLNKLNQIVDTINAQDTDFTFLLGDFDDLCMTKASISPDEVSKILSKIKTRYGKIAILGNHDYKMKSLIPKILADSNILLLEDNFIKEKVNDQSLYIVGIKDLWKFPKAKIDLLTKIKDKKPIIFLSHNPDIFPTVPDKVSISFAGHLHGGLFILPLLGGLITISDYDQRFLKGLVVENGKHFYITRGCNSGPYTLNNPPEVVVLTLKYPKSTSQIIQNTPPRIGVPRGGVDVFVKVRAVINKIKGLV